MMHFFEEPIPDGWVYACGLDDLKVTIQRIPPKDLEGLWAVGLAASTRKNCSANGRYFRGEKPTIRIYSYPASLSYRQPPHTKLGSMESGMDMEIAYGMRVEESGTRITCSWRREDLRRFLSEHVLLHEVGHHVYHLHRKRMNLRYGSRSDSERFAEEYARRTTGRMKLR